ncbi:YcjF family protein [Gloeocapsa sp. PCC 73106]|uniref:YcjF family protein n=1 Tax=Gloeocapsa sp. PCC 73106 TaxID=102232 RepID=UPI0002ABB031|nr:GTP-binding protein [Gloeocapsa sp. PCC 73106]ELR98651.1 small GTP-binding protein domain protein [Gloeocapsa sp. PCC 73106]
MSLARFLTIVIGLSVVIGLMLWLTASIYQLYIQIAYTSLLLANLLVFLLIILLVTLIAVFLYYFNLPGLKRSPHSQKKTKRVPQVSWEKTEAATETLKAIRQQLEQIQDEVAREALLKRSQEIEENLARGEYRVVIFGTGSAGKTSLVNALLGEIVGKVEPTMGTTQIGETYSLYLPGLQRRILITDTPGILEMGIEGNQRENLACQLATEADLLLFVVDNDIRQSEYQPLRTLVEIGKRSLLVFNKIDLYSDQDQQVILTNLQQRVQAFLSPNDVVAISASPQSVRLANGELMISESQIIPLIKRLVALLRAEGEDLIADNILLQSQRLGEEARSLLDQQRKRQADRIIDRYQWIGAGVIAMTPLPVLDMLATAAVNAQMVVEIGQVYGCELNRARGQELALSLGKTLISLGVVKGALDLIAKALQLNLATYLLGKAIQGVTAAYLTRIAGKSFVEYFRQDQDWGDGGITEVVQKQFQLSRKDEFVKGFVKDALNKVVQPLTEALGENWEPTIVESPDHQDEEW